MGVSVNTLRRWLSQGRNNPDGPYGDFAREADRARSGEFDVAVLARDFVSACLLAFAGDKTELGRIRARAELHQGYISFHLAHIIVVAAALHCEGDKPTVEGVEKVLEGWEAVSAVVNEHVAAQRNAA